MQLILDEMQRVCDNMKPIYIDMQNKYVNLQLIKLTLKVFVNKQFFDIDMRDQHVYGHGLICIS